MKRRRNRLSTIERRTYDEEITEAVLRSQEYRLCRRLFCYMSFGTEFNTENIIHQALNEEKQVFLPRAEAGHRLEFYRIDGLQALERSSYGIPEPVPEEAKRYQGTYPNETSEANLMLMPGLAFDCTGNRIGYGAGYYDRYLIRFPARHFNKIAVCYDFQLLEQIHSEEYDIRADAIITPSRQIYCY